MLANIIFDLQNLKCTYTDTTNIGIYKFVIFSTRRNAIYIFREKLHLHGHFGC